MKTLAVFAALTAILNHTCGFAISEISAKGFNFFFAREIAPQLTPHDANTTQYDFDSQFMKAFGEAGVYRAVDLDDFDSQVEQNDTAAVFGGNEVLTTKNGSCAVPYILSAAGDIRPYHFGLMAYGNASKEDAKKDDISAIITDGEPPSITLGFSQLKACWATLTPADLALSDHPKQASTIPAPPRPASTPRWGINASSTQPTRGQMVTTSTTGAKTAKTGSEKTPGESQESNANQLLSTETPASTVFSLMAGALIGLGALMGWFL